MKKQPTTMTMLTLWVGVWMAASTILVDAQSTLSNCEEKPQRSRCQRACKCDCSDYWNTDTFCLQVCNDIDNGSPVDALSWCSDYNVADDCDQYDSNWSDSTIQSNLHINYMRAYGRDFSLNFFTDTARSELLPLAVIIHGGGFNSGSKDNCKIVESAREFASRGYRSVAISYPLCGAYWNGTDVDENVTAFGSDGPWHAWDAEEPLYPPGVGQQHPQCIYGAASSKAHPEQYAQSHEVANRAARYAVQYAHSRAEEWGIDVEQTVCNGASAGAITCYEMFLFNTTVRFRPQNTGLEPVPDLDQIKINVAAGRAGALVPPEVRAVTEDTVAAMAPGAAVYDLHGDEDTVVDISKAQFLVETMEEFLIPAELDIATGEGHSIFEYQFNKTHPERLNTMFDFIELYLSGNVGEDDDVDNDDVDNDDDVDEDDDDVDNDDDNSVCEDDDNAIKFLAASRTPPVFVNGCRQVARKGGCSKTIVVELCCQSCANFWK